MKNRVSEPPATEIEPGLDVEVGRISLGKQTFRAFKNRAFYLYFVSMVGQWAPMNMQMMTRSLLVYRITDSAAILGLVSLGTAIPTLLLSLFGGAIADRVQKKYVLLAGQASSGVVALGIALALTFGYVSVERPGSWWILMAGSVLQGTIMGLMMPSRHAMIRDIVSRDQLMNAVALNNLGMNTLRLLAPAAAGFLIEAIGFRAVYYTMTGMYLMSVIPISFLPRTSTITLRVQGTLADIIDGFRYVRRETTILLILALTLLSVTLSMPYVFLMPVFTDDILKVGAWGMGVLLSVSGIGAMGGSLILASLPNKKRGLMLLTGTLLLGLVLLR